MIEFSPRFSPSGRDVSHRGPLGRDGGSENITIFLVIYFVDVFLRYYLLDYRYEDVNYLSLQITLFLATIRMKCNY